MESIYIDHEKGGEEVAINVHADFCPHCHKGMQPHFLYGYVDDYALFVSYRCVLNKCKKYFVTRFTQVDNGIFYFRGYETGESIPFSSSEIIQKMSPSFVEVYQQALEAEDKGLDEICGMGFRKSLEFLIKDYIIDGKPELEDQVKSKFLGDCIKDYIDEPKIKNMAQRAAWLGNDESHYVKKWEGLDVTNLKQLIELTIHAIESDDLMKKMISAMPTGKK